MIAESASSLPLWLLYEDELEAWRRQQAPAVGAWLEEQNFRGEKHRVLLVPEPSGALKMAVGGLGRRQGGICLWNAAGLAERLPPRRFHLAQPFTEREAEQLCLGFAYGAYRFDRYRPGSRDRMATVDPPANADPGFIRCAAESLALARDLINTPANDLGPAELADAVRKVAQNHGAAFHEWVGGDLLAAGFPAIHAVGRASASPPRLLELCWAPAGGDSLPLLTLVGKGVCFDSGGLDLKSSSGMALMKKDMGGAAVALGLANMLMHGGIAARLRVLIPAVENAVGGNAYRPGDVLATRKGLTVEVGNTDAEGRLVLCDALALADSDRPELLIDFATLTGAARVALGPELPALFGSDEPTVAELVRIAAAEHDPLWPMPLWMPYDDELASKVADLCNVAASGLAGAIFGALYLKRFVTETRNWLHIDLYAWNSKERPGRPVGGEAQTVRGLYRYLTARFGCNPRPG
jgi:leucyl aminopeptidase